MLEMKLTITAPELSEAINNLAKAIDHATTNQIGMTNGATPINTTCAAAEKTAPTAEPQTPAAPVAPTPTAAPTAVPTAPATPAPTSAVPTAPAAPAAPTVPTAAPQYTLDMIAKAGTALVDAGKMNELTALLAKYGVEALTALNPAYYGAFANELRAIGAQI